MWVSEKSRTGNSEKLKKMRTDRIISLFFYRLSEVSGRKKIPILMYHSITPDIKRKGHPYYCIDTSPETFERQMLFLKKNGWNVLALNDLINLHVSTNRNVKKTVIISFDDGYKNFYEYALPILRKYDLTATVFIPTNLIGESESIEFNDKPLMTWGELKESKKKGISIGSHSCTHRLLVELEEEHLANELIESKNKIEQRLDQKCTLFSYPYKFPEGNIAFTRLFREVFERSGYELGVSTKIGRTSINDPRHCLKRIPVNEFDDLSFFKAKLLGGYDWLYTLQFIKKKFHNKSSSGN